MPDAQATKSQTPYRSSVLQDPVRVITSPMCTADCGALSILLHATAVVIGFTQDRAPILTPLMPAAAAAAGARGGKGGR